MALLPHSHTAQRFRGRAFSTPTSHKPCRLSRQRCAAAASQDIEIPAQELSTAQHIIINDRFDPELARELREVFDERFRDPRRIHENRFTWDPWFCTDAAGTTQYSLLRTQAQVYFNADLNERLVNELLSYGESQLGCRSISTIWISLYTDGHLQEFHCDNPHGPFAFVLSLTEWEGHEFTGGETMVMQPQTLNYWHRANHGAGLEHCDLIKLIPPLFGRLLIFDPRFPHGVRRVHGSPDPRKGRLVLHGWFTDPSPFFSGPLDPEAASPVLNEAIQGATEESCSHPSTGVLTLRLHVDGVTGSVREVQFLADTLVPLPSVDVDPAEVRAEVLESLQTWLLDAQFPTAEGDTVITLPVVFEG